MVSSMSGGKPRIAQGEKRPHGYEYGQIQQFTPEAMDLYQQLFGHLGPDSFLSKLASGDQSMFEQMEKPALKQFGQMQGGLASRFSGQGMGSRRSSGFQNTSNQAATDFAQQLQSQRMGLQNQAIRDLMGMSNSLLGQRPYEQFMVEKQKKQNPWGSIIGTGVGAVGGFFAGGPAGAVAGAQTGNQIGSSF